MEERSNSKSNFSSKRTKFEANEKEKEKLPFKKREKDKVKQKALEKQRKMRKKRLIVRNLSFKVNEEELKTIFSKYGNVVDVTIPLMENKKKRGFAFVQFEEFHSLIKAMKELNYKEIRGRPIAIDYAVNKTKYQEKMASIKSEKEAKKNSEIVSESQIKEEIEESDDDESGGDESEASSVVSETKSAEDISESDKRVQSFFKEFDAGSKADASLQVEEESSNSESSDAESDEEHSEDGDEDDQHSEDGDEDDQHSEDCDENDQNYTKQKKRFKSDEKPFNPAANKTRSNDVSEGKTVFMRNVSFVTTEEGLQEAMEEHGEFEYCLLCMDPVTDHPKGTAFVKFRYKEDADKLIEKASDEPGIFLDGRRVQCSYAISKDALRKQSEEKAKQPKDKRNLHLLKAGLIMPNSKEAEGVSQTDMKKRMQLEISKKQKLKNLNFFVSDKRLLVYNVPADFTDAKLRKLFHEAAGSRSIVTEARIMKDLKKTDEKGSAVSRGFAFVSFTWREDALRALEKLNNNPSVFTSQKRPIIEFSIENKLALLTKERRRQNQMKNKKRQEEKTEQLNEQAKIKSSQGYGKGIVLSNKRKKVKWGNESSNKKIVNENVKSNNSVKKWKQSNHRGSEQSKQQVKSNKKTKKSVKNQEGLSDLINKYKEKLLNKI